MSSLGYASEPEAQHRSQPTRHRSEGLAKLVSKYEILDALSIIESPTNSPRHPPSPRSMSKTLQEASANSQKRHWPSMTTTDLRHASLERNDLQRPRGSSVAERRKLFEHHEPKTPVGCSTVRPCPRLSASAQVVECSQTASEQVSQGRPQPSSRSHSSFKQLTALLPTIPVVHSSGPNAASDDYSISDREKPSASPHIGLEKVKSPQTIAMLSWEQQPQDASEYQASASIQGHRVTRDASRAHERDLLGSFNQCPTSRRRTSLEQRVDTADESNNEQRAPVGKRQGNTDARFYRQAGHLSSDASQPRSRPEPSLTACHDEPVLQMLQRTEAIGHGVHAEHVLQQPSSSGHRGQPDLRHLPTSTSASAKKRKAMATEDKKPPNRSQTLSKSMTTGWLGIGERLGHENSGKILSGFKGRRPGSTQERQLSEPARRRPSPIAQRIGMFEKLSCRHIDENTIAAKVPAASNKSKARTYRDQLSISPLPSSPSLHTELHNAQTPQPAVHELLGASSCSPVLDKHRLRQKAAAVRERLCSISSTSTSCSALKHGLRPHNVCTSSQYTASSDCVALLSPESIETLTSDDRYERAAREASSPGSTLRKNPPPQGHVKLGSGNWFRRHISRSDQLAVVKAHCALHQPQPVRGIEVRRLASLCRDKVSARLYRGSG
ncbi:hypothetical protein LIA77_02880 [Sarocladium implicatum]|nr:hypothetical protein LIA77_02880 [Sarocladium implicatum]